MSKEWEYKVIPFPNTTDGIEAIENQLNLEGDLSFELVSIINYPKLTKVLNSELAKPLDNDFYAIFKKPKES